MAVAEHGSVTAAAKALNFAQPSVSHHLTRLQAETGVQLITRVGRGVRLTPEGEALARRAQGRSRTLRGYAMSSLGGMTGCQCSGRGNGDNQTPQRRHRTRTLCRWRPVTTSDATQEEGQPLSPAIVPKEPYQDREQRSDENDHQE